MRQEQLYFGGYKIIKIFELWEYEVESGMIKAVKNMDNLTYESLLTQSLQTKRKKKISGLFTQYQNTFVQIKTESSGWPNWCQSDEDKKRYIVDFYKENNI